MNLRKICIDVYGRDTARLNSIDLQLVGYSWPDPTRHAIEFVVFAISNEDDYGERIIEVDKNNYVPFCNVQPPNVQLSPKNEWEFIVHYRQPALPKGAKKTQKTFSGAYKLHFFKKVQVYFACGWCLHLV